jgi:hypothetical protein
MNNSLENIKQMTQDLLGDIAQQKDYHHLHSKALYLLLNIVELQSHLNEKPATSNSAAADTSNDSNMSIEEEIRKVARKLPKWAQNQGQINSKILTLFLTLKREGQQKITEDMLSDNYGDISEFYRNYPQMKGISPKNHAKVFESRLGVVEIWEPVKSYVAEYERSVFSKN